MLWGQGVVGLASNSTQFVHACPQSLGLSGAKTPCPYANYADQYPKDNMTDSEQCFGVFARMQT
jgi:hypothetical protein